MILSSDRQSYLTHLLVNTLEKRGFVRYKDAQKAHLIARQTFQECQRVSLEIEQKIEDKIRSLKRNINEQSSEWQVLYNNYIEEELVRRGIISTKAK